MMSGVIISILVLAIPTFGHRFLWREYAMEGLYLNTSDGCTSINHRQQRDICQSFENITTLLKTAAYMATVQCHTAFQFELWPCTINNQTFRKVTREQVFLTSLFAASLSLNCALWCSVGNIKNCSKSEYNSSFLVNYGANITNAYLKTDGIEDLVGIITSHSIKVGISVVKKLQVMKCKCYGISGFCYHKTCWVSPPTLSRVTQELKKRYHNALLWKSNSILPAKKMKNRLVFLDSSMDYCSQTKQRICFNKDSCTYICCGRGFTTTEVDNKVWCNCTWADNFDLNCKICINKIKINTCQ